MTDILCIKKDSFKEILNCDSYLNIDGSDILTLETHFVDRYIAEVDESYIQIIPYVTLIDIATDKIFRYRRGKDSDESKLAGKYSIGISGHMYDLTFNQRSGNITQLTGNAIRVLDEEVYICDVIDYDVLHSQIDDILTNRKFTVIWNNTTPESAMHVAIAFTIKVDMTSILTIDGKWLDMSEINQMTESNKLLLEDWSKVLVKTLKENIFKP